MTIVSEFSDEGFSGKNIKGRPEFTRMMEKIESGEDDVDFVLVFKLSRFGRNAADVLNSLQTMQDYGVNLICVEDGIDSSKDAGKLMISVLSAVAEIERENIRTQTMAGREQKAKEGKWNGGFAPYGYKLENGQLLIADDEVEIIRIIYDRYIHTNSGINGVASYLNDNGYTKKLRQNNTIPGFSSGFVKSVLDNPVYMGKIAYGRRRTEKKIGTRNEMHIVEQDEYPIYDGHHEAIISEADWQLAQEKRKANNFKREKVHDIEHAHILSDLLKCPCCGKSLYGNIAKAHSKDKYTRYYYYCKNTLGATGHKCSFRLNIEQTKMNRMVAAIISAMVKDKRFKDAIKAKIGTAVDTSEMEKRIEALRTQLKQVQGTKTRLEHQMDNLDVLDTHYKKKISDLQRRYDEQYDKAEAIETQMDEWNSRLLSVRQEKISADNVYQLLLAFDKLYNTFTEVEQRDFMRAFIERIDIYPEKPDNGCWIRNIVFNFPMPVQGQEIKNLPLESESTVETVVLLSNWAVTVVLMSYGKIEIYKSRFMEENMDGQELYQLAMKHIYGDGVPEDNDLAFKLLTQAHEIGHVEATYNLGICYHYGFGTSIDLAKAFELYLESADAGYGKGMELVGRFYNRGIYVAQNRERAELWLAKAMQSSDTDVVEEAKKELSVTVCLEKTM